jgi:hypothetical protein
LLEKDGRERCRPVETTPMKDERPAREERDALGGKMKKFTPPNVFWPFRIQNTKEKKIIIK